MKKIIYLIGFILIMITIGVGTYYIKSTQTDTNTKGEDSISMKEGEGDLSADVPENGDNSKEDPKEDAKEDTKENPQNEIEIETLIDNLEADKKEQDSNTVEPSGTTEKELKIHLDESESLIDSINGGPKKQINGTDKTIINDLPEQEYDPNIKNKVTYPKGKGEPIGEQKVSGGGKGGDGDSAGGSLN